MDDLSALEQQAHAVEDLLLPGLRGRLAVVRAFGAALRVSLLATVPTGIVVGVAWGVEVAGGPGALLGLALGGLLGFLPEVARRALLVRGYRHVLARAGESGLQAVGGSTSVALPSWTPGKKAPAPAEVAPVFVAPVRPPPRVGDLDAEDFDDD